MSYSLRVTKKMHGKYPGVRYLIVEDGTPNVAMHKKQNEAEVSLRLLKQGKATFCECGNFVLGVPGRIGSHFCSIVSRMVNQ